jgi:hypothetical protein
MTTPSPTPDDAPLWARPLFERQIDVSGQLAEAGLQMALMVRNQAVAATQEGGVEAVVLESFTRAFAKAARAARLSVMLQEKLVKALIAFDAAAATAATPAQPERLEIVRVFVERDGEKVDGLKREAREQLDREPGEDLALGRPTDAVAAEIRRDLGICPEGRAAPAPAPAPSWGRAPAAKRRDTGGFRGDYPHRPSG